MSASNEIQTILAPVRSRLRNRAAIILLGPGALFGGLLCLVMATVRWGFEIPVSWTFPAIALIGGLVVAATIGLLAQRTWSEAAKVVDQHYKLKDRAATALEFSHEESDSAFRILQLADAQEHLINVNAQDVVPYSPPRQWKLSLATVAAAFAFMMLPLNQSASQANVVSREGLNEAVETIEQEVQEIEELAEEAGIEELETLVDELKKDLAALDDPEAEVRQSLETVSEMQQKLQDLMASLNVAAMDAQLAEVGEALESAEAFREVAEALKNGEFTNAAEGLEEVDPEEMDRTESRPTAEKLADAAEAADEKKLEELSELLKKLADSVKEESVDSIREGSSQLADSIRKHDMRKKMSNMLASKIQQLGDSKKLFAGGADKAGNGGSGSDKEGVNLAKGKTEKKSNTSSRKAGSESAGNVDGDKTALESQRQMAKLTGQLGAEGDSEFETETTEESDATATRKAQETFAKYQKMSEAVLEQEAIPTGHRRTIRKYFELIRPTKEAVED